MKTDIKLFEKLSKKRSLIPLNGKAAFEKGWTKYCEEKRDFKASDFEGKNAGIACGPASGIIVLDIDDPELFRSTRKEKGWRLRSTYKVLTGGGGYHHYFKYPDDGRIYGNKGLKGKYGFDIRGHGGQVVAPGSVHPDTGEFYDVVKDRKIAEAPDWLLELAAHSEDKPKEDLKETFEAWDGNIDSLRISQGIKVLIQHRVPKGKRSEEMMRVLAALAKANISDPDIIKIFESHGIGEKYREKGQYREKWLRPQIDKARSFVSSPDTHNKNQSLTLTSVENQDLTFTSVQDLLAMDFENLTPVIGEGILPETCGLLIAGDSGVGKSLITLEWAIHLAMGLDLYGGGLLIPNARKVMIFQRENIPPTVQERMFGMLEELGIKDLPDNIFFANQEFRYNVSDYECVKKMISAINESGADVYIADPLSSFHTKDENSNIEMRRVMDTFTDISRATGAAVIIIHHFKKPQKGQLDVNRVRGAKSLVDWADTLLTFEVKTKGSDTVHKRKLGFIKIRNGREKDALTLNREKDKFTHILSKEGQLELEEMALDTAKIIEDHFEGMAPSQRALVDEMVSTFDISQGTARKRIGYFVLRGYLLKIKRSNKFCYKVGRGIKEIR